MARPCTVCVHRDCEEIERLLVAALAGSPGALSVGRIASDSGLTAQSIKRHMDGDKARGKSPCIRWSTAIAQADALHQQRQAERGDKPSPVVREFDELIADLDSNTKIVNALLSPRIERLRTLQHTDDDEDRIMVALRTKRDLYLALGKLREMAGDTRKTGVEADILERRRDKADGTADGLPDGEIWIIRRQDG